MLSDICHLLLTTLWVDSQTREQGKFFCQGKKVAKSQGKKVLRIFWAHYHDYRYGFYKFCTYDGCFLSFATDSFPNGRL